MKTSEEMVESIYFLKPAWCRTHLAGLWPEQGLQPVTAATAFRRCSSLITDEFPSKRAIMLEGVGPQLRIYCRFGIKAVEEGAKVDALTWNPTAGDWTMHVPCDADNMKWVKDSLVKTSARIKVFDVDDADRAEEEESSEAAKSNNALVVDWNIGGSL